MNHTIRAAKPDDGPALYVQWMDLRKYNASIDRRIMNAPVSEAEFLAGFREVLAREESIACVAEVQGRLAGFVSGGIGLNQPDRLPERHATIGYLWVGPQFRRHGIARDLFSAVAEWAIAQPGVSHFEMPVLAADEQAAGFWQAIGFSPFIERLWAPLSAPERDA